MLAQLLECFYKLLEYFEIKHVTGDLSRSGSWCFLLFFGLENPRKQWLFLLHFRTCSFSTVLSRTLKWRAKNEKELEIFTRCFKIFLKINQSINFLPSLANLKTAWSSYQVGYHIISRMGSLKIITKEQKPMIHFNSKVQKNQEVSRVPILFNSIYPSHEQHICRGRPNTWESTGPKVRMRSLDFEWATSSVWPGHTSKTLRFVSSFAPHTHQGSDAQIIPHFPNTVRL